ncbi:hypothetical protein COCON_G00002620, partial [Conger conger]
HTHAHTHRCVPEVLNRKSNFLSPFLSKLCGTLDSFAIETVCAYTDIGRALRLVGLTCHTVRSSPDNIPSFIAVTLCDNIQ